MTQAFAPPAFALAAVLMLSACAEGWGHDRDHDHDHDHDWDYDHHRRMIWWHQPHYGVVEYSAPVVTAAPAPCNCLTKRYLQDGSVLFKDLCTKEEAMATPEELRAQAQGVSPQVQ